MRLSPGAMLLLLAMPAQAQDTGDAVRSITGFSLQELKACHSDDECMLVSGLDNCCKWEVINKGHQADIEHNRNKLRDTLTTDDMKKHCSLVECQPPLAKAVCRKNACASEALH